MRKSILQSIGSTAAGIAVLACVASSAMAQSVTGQWDFDNAADGFSATVGSDGYVWIRPNTDQSGEVQFGTCSSFGITLTPGGDSRVMRFPAFDSFNGIAVWPGIGANGGGFYVNNYTIIYDLLYPQASANDWRSLWQTNECNTNDGDFFINPQDGVGISGTYEGSIQPNTWRRVALAVGLDGDPNFPSAVVDKYIDGALVGSQVLEAAPNGIDSRWSLYTEADGFPSMVFADNDGDTALGYVASMQLRDYRMTATEVAALGGVTAAGIPGGTGVAGLWNFENPANGYQATTGNDLTPWNAFTAGCADPTCTQDLNATTQFGTTGTTFPQVPNLPDGPAGVMYYDAAEGCTGYLFPHGAEANGGGTRVNDYSVIMDLYWTPDDFTGVTAPTHDPGWTSVYQTSPTNNEDAMLWIDTLTGSLGDDGQYDGTAGWIQPSVWMRVVATVFGSAAGGPVITKYVIYADDTHVGPVAQIEVDEGLDSKRSMVTNESAFGEDIFLAFSDFDSFYTHRGFVNSIQIRNFVMSEADVLALGGPRASGIPRPSCTGDLNNDGIVNLADLAILLSNFGSGGAGPEDGDTNGDGVVDLTDLATLLSAFGSNC